MIVVRWSLDGIRTIDFQDVVLRTASISQPPSLHESCSTMVNLKGPEAPMPSRRPEGNHSPHHWCGTRNINMNNQ
jgi:hypothetical protein